MSKIQGGGDALDEIGGDVALVNDTVPALICQRAVAQRLQRCDDIVPAQPVGMWGMRQAYTSHDGLDLFRSIFLELAHQLNAETDNPAMHKRAPRQILDIVGKEMLRPFFGAIMAEGNTDIVNFQITFDNGADALITEGSNLFRRLVLPPDQPPCAFHRLQHIVSRLLSRIIGELPIERGCVNGENITASGNVEFGRRSPNQVVINNYQFGCDCADILHAAIVAHSYRLCDIGIGGNNGGYVDERATAFPRDVLAHINCLSAANGNDSIARRRCLLDLPGTVQVHILYVNHLDRLRSDLSLYQFPGNGHTGDDIASKLRTEAIDETAPTFQAFDIRMW